jgi:protocatechuate 3,4-dioxygenase beta subunit
MSETDSSDKYGIIDSVDSITPAVIKSMSRTPDARLREVMESFVRHAHAFVREVRPTEQEFERGIAFLNAIGQTTTDKYNDAVLFCDVFGISSLVTTLANGLGGPMEPATALLGPFWRLNHPITENGASIVRCPTPGPALFAHIRLIGTDGTPIAGAEVDVWHASSVGMYDVQDENQVEWNLRGKFITDDDGRFSFRSIKPVGYPIPVHGPSGPILAAQLRKPQRPAHLHFLAYKPGFKTLISQVFVADDPDIERDVTFGVTPHLIGDFRRQTGPAPASDVSGEWYSIDHTLVMSPGEAVLPTPPIA